MASRGAFGFRSAKQSEKADQKERIPTGAPRRASITSETSNISKPASQTSSFFSRSKSRAKADPSASKASSIPLGRPENSGKSIPASSEPRLRRVAEPSRNAGLGISTVNQISAAQMPKTGKQARNVLRRKAPLDRHGGTESSASSHEPTPSQSLLETASSPEGYRDPFAGSVLGITVPPVSSTSAPYQPSGLGPSSEYATSSSRMATYNTRTTPQSTSTPNFPPPNLNYAHDSGSSTRRSESPGAFSRTSTPTSMSSQSPGVGTPVKAPLRTRQATSPTRSRPPVTRRKFPGVTQQEDVQTRGLTAVRESATSSSSSSTVKAPERRDASQPRSASDRSTPLPPSPPTRQSSMRYIPRSEGVGPKRDIPREAPERGARLYTEMQRDPPFVSAQGDTTQINRYRTPPPRPSREGTPKLDDNFDQVQVIHTRLPPLQTTGYRSRPSLEKDTWSAESRLGAPYSSRATLERSPSNASSISVKPSRMPSPNLATVRGPRFVPGEQPTTHAGPFPETNNGAIRSDKDPSPMSAGSSKSSSRFGLFTKRTRSPLEASTSDSADVAARKGPAAGTGHEGYGKYARRGRSGSASTSASRGRSTSTNSAGRTPTSRKSSFTSRDEPEMDDFLRERLAPVVMTGRGRAADRPTLGPAFVPTGSGNSLVAQGSSEDHLIPKTRVPILPEQEPVRSDTSSTEPISTHHLRRDHRRLPHRQDNPEYAFEQQQKGFADFSHRAPTLAARRSVHRSQVFGEEAAPVKLPTPIDTRAVAASPGIDSRGTIQSSIRTDISDDITEGHEGNWLKSRKTEKRARSPRKWNFFQRTQYSPRRTPESIVPRSDDDQGDVGELPTAVSRLPESRSVAFYQLLDGSEQEGLDQVGMTRGAERSQPESNYSSIPASANSQEALDRPDRRLSSLLPSPPKLSGEFLRSLTPLSPSVILRLPEPVASATPAPMPEPKKPRLQQVGRIPRVVSKRDRLHKPPPQSFSRPFARRPTALGEATEERGLETSERPLLGIQTEILPSDPWGTQSSAQPASAPARPMDDFRDTAKDEFLAFPLRIGSEVSASSSSGILSFAPTIAVVPQPGMAPDEDEVWNEYNEFLDTVEPSPAPLASESKNPLEKTLRNTGWAPAPLQITKEPSMTGSPERRGPTINLPFAAPTKPLPVPPDRSKLLSIEPPSTPNTISDLLAGYGDRNRSSGVTNRQSRSTTSRYSTSSIETDADSLAGRENSDRTITPQAVGGTSSTGLGIQSNLRFDALMTSRWLSFDRVLFSPAHAKVRSGRVLVLDGLRNDDWSFYCAETYTTAGIFNLSPTPSRPQQQTSALQLPQNHRQIQHTKLENRFPFPPGFFAAAVLRFPAATAESAYLNAIAECMRVLCPGGYLEMMILDLDMVNMGNKARKALRELKLRMQVSSPGVSLKPLSDNLQKMAKRSGFENLNRCMVNVPVAGPVNSSRSGSFDGNSKSLEDLRKESSGKGDGGLAKSLPTVGRWWFTRCYETVSMPYNDVERSIWNDKALLEECEKRETGFKLLLCYAQKPADPNSMSGSPPRVTKKIGFRP